MTDSLTVFGTDFTGVTGIKATGTGNGTLTYIRPQGTKSISANGTGIDVAAYANVDVAVPSSVPSLQSKTKSYTPTETAQSETVSDDSGYDGLSSVDISVGAISSTYVGSGITQRSSSDLTASNATVTVPAGYYSEAASKDVASGSVTASATKGTVSNHQVLITPKASTTAGYVYDGIYNGTSVTVSASELVSGTYTVDSSGTKDVTNYASASVAAGGATASASKGSVSNHSISITPTVTRTAGWVSAGTANGTAVSVSASELVSGNLALTGNTASANCANYATVSVAVPFSTIYTGTSNPSSSQGVNGDVYLKTVS